MGNGTTRPGTAEIGSTMAKPVAGQSRQPGTAAEILSFVAPLAARVGSWAWNLRTDEFLVDEAKRVLFGFGSQDVPVDLQSWLQRAHPDDRGPLVENVQNYLSGEVPNCEICYRMKTAGDEYSWCWSRGSLVVDAAGDKHVAGTTVVLDMEPGKRTGVESELLRAELTRLREQLAAERARRERTERLSHSTAEATSTESEGLYVDLARQLGEILGHKAVLICEHLGFPWSQSRVLARYFDGEVRDDLGVLNIAGTPCETQKGRDILHYPTNLQQLFPADQFVREAQLDSYIGVPFADSRGAVVGHLCVMDDKPTDLEDLAHLRIFATRAATEFERRRELAERRCTEQQLSLVLAVTEQVEDAIAILTMKGPEEEPVVEYANPSFRALVGERPRDPIGESVLDLVEGIGQARQNLAGAAAFEFDLAYEPEVSRRRVHARFLPIRSATNEVTHWSVSFRDVTDSREAEERERRHENELAHVSRLTTLGEMSTGLAHDLNQPLAAIGSYAFACQQSIPDDLPNRDRILSYLSEIEGQRALAGEIITRIRAFVRRGQPHASTHPMNQVVLDALRYIRNGDGARNVEIRTDLEPRDPRVLVDKVQIEQVILNLTRNAFEAMEAAGVSSPRLTVTTRIKDRHVILQVSDNGPGMADEVAARAFETFFTTKSGGLGMGLPICRTIVESHQGRFWAERPAKRGLSMCVALPLVEG